MKIIQKNCKIETQNIIEQNSDKSAVDKLIENLISRLKVDSSIPNSIRDEILKEAQEAIRRGDAKAGRWDSIKGFAQNLAGFASFAELAKSIIEAIE